MTLAQRSPAAATDEAAVRTVLGAIAEAYRARDAAAVARHFAPDAIVADLAPPLVRRGFDAAGAQAWLDGWGGPVELTDRDLVIHVDGDLAICHGLQHTRTQTRDGEDAAWWCRTTLALARTDQGWRITHAHSSVPFYMDGSDRAATDLEP
jgi:ketosteroid isomerase-like protein